MRRLGRSLAIAAAVVGGFLLLRAAGVDEQVAADLVLGLRWPADSGMVPVDTGGW